jgi:pimeloyl-ACP methyl ester carboxylesterase
MAEACRLLATTVETHRDGRRLRVARLGEGPPLILLHGYPDNLQIWCELAPRLADRFELIAFDWPGMGQSEAWPGGATPYHMADRLLELVDAWALERAGIVAMDMGAQPALAFAALHPDRVSFLVAGNCLAFWDVETSWEIALLRKFKWNQLILHRLPAAAFRRAEKTFLPRDTRLSPTLRADLWQSFKQKEVRRFIVRMCAGYQGTLPRLPDLYGDISCPTLVLWAEGDKHFPTAHAFRLHAAIPRSELKIVTAAEHWMALHVAPAVAGEIHRYHRSLP